MVLGHPATKNSVATLKSQWHFSRPGHLHKAVHVFQRSTPICHWDRVLGNTLRVSLPYDVNLGIKFYHMKQSGTMYNMA